MLKKIIYFYRQTSTYHLILFCSLLGLALASRVLYIQHGWVNNDFVLYHEMARLFSVGEWAKGMAIFQWPLYPLLIASIHNITGIQITDAAKLLTAIMFMITTYSFLTIITLLNNTKTNVISGVIILFSANYLVEDVLPMLLRDTGFWAFLLLSIVFFIRFYQTKKLSDATFWQICAIIATLFRLEGISFLIGLPVILLYSRLSIKSKFKSFASTYAIIILVFISACYLIWSSDQISVSSTGRLQEIASPTFLTELTQKFSQSAAIMSEKVLGHFLNDYAAAGLILTFLYIMLVKVISATGIIQTSLALFATKNKRHLMNVDAFKVLTMTGLIAAMNGFLIITKVFVLSSRYMMPVIFILMIFASIFLGDWIRNRKENMLTLTSKLAFFSTIIFLSLSLANNLLPKHPHYNYQQDAVSWLDSINTKNLPVFYDATRVRFYAKQPFISNWGDSWTYLNQKIEQNELNEFHYLMINIPKHHPEYAIVIAKKLPNFKEIKRFYSSSKKYIAIYEKNE